jgi:hypothetical protein
MYEFRIKNDDKKRKYFKFDEIPHPRRENEHFDLLNILKTVFNDLNDLEGCLKDESEEGDNGKRIYLKSWGIKNRTIYGLVAYGFYGNERDIKNVSDTSKEDRVILEEEGVFDPHYFLLTIPKDQDIGCLVLERKGGTGIRSIFEHSILGRLVDYPDFAYYKIVLRRAYPKELRERFYEKGQLLSLKYYLHELPEDLIDEIKVNTGEVETIVKVKDELISPENFFEDNKDNLLTFQGIEYDEVKVDSKYKDKKKSFIITNPDTLIPYLDVTDEIKTLIKGNPKLECIDNIARKHVKINFERIWDDGTEIEDNGEC